MKARPMKQTDSGQIDCTPEEATHVWLNMPGPLPYRCIPIVHGNATRKGTPCWSWNGDVEKPTLKPSIRTKGGGTKNSIVCHSFVNDGKVQFLGDCTHEFANKTVDLLEVDI